MTRFRGMISTQPGSTPLTSFKILSLDDVDGHGGCSAGTEIGEGAAMLLSPQVHDPERRLFGTVSEENDRRVSLVSGPYGERDDQQVFIQRVVPDTDKLYVRLSSNGKR